MSIIQDVSKTPAGSHLTWPSDVSIARYFEKSGNWYSTLTDEKRKPSNILVTHWLTTATVIGQVSNIQAYIESQSLRRWTVTLDLFIAFQHLSSSTFGRANFWGDRANSQKTMRSILSKHKNTLPTKIGVNLHFIMYRINCTVMLK